MPKKPKIAVIGLKGLPAFGGAAAVGENIIEQLKEEFEFTVYSTSSHTSLKTGYINGYKHIVFSSISKSSINTLFYYIKSVIHCLFYQKYDIIHLHHNAVLFLIPLLKIRSKVILTTHGIHTESKFRHLKWVFKLFDYVFLPMADRITTVSKLDYSTAIKLKKNNVIYIPNGVIIEDKVKFSDPIIENDYLLFASGRIFETKGCHLFLEALSKIEFNGKILIVGDTTHDKAYQKKLFEISKNIENIYYLGLIKDKNKLNNLISNAMIFIYPSYVESMSMMLLEVASLKTPIICSCIKANKDVFSENEVTFVKPNNTCDLQKKINWCLSNRDNIEKKAINALRLIKQNHDWKDISNQYGNVYQSIKNTNFE